MPRITRLFLQSVTVCLSLLLVFASPVMAQTQDWTGNCVSTMEGATDVATIQGFSCFIANIFSVAIALIGFIGFVMLVVGSFRYLLSGGSSKGTEDARKTMTFAIVGLVVALSAFIILGLVARFTGVGIITQFIIPTSDSGLNGPMEIREPEFDVIVDPRPPGGVPAPADEDAGPIFPPPVGPR